MGACVLNQVQEWKLDARMERTRTRPIPAGRMKPRAALAVAVPLVAGGVVVLWWQHNPVAALMGLGTVAWYNGAYTYLKRTTAAAVIPGALTGALPPVIGWTAAGGRPLDPHGLALAFFFLVWQVPHFWLLLLSVADDYERAGLPSLTQRFTGRQVRSLVFIWMLTTVAASFLLPICLPMSSLWISVGLVPCGLWMVREASKLQRPDLSDRLFFPMFRAINAYVFVVMALLVADAML